MSLMQMTTSIRPKMPPLMLPSQKYYRCSTVSCRAPCNNGLLSREKKKNFYEILSLQSDMVGFDEIKKAYRSMVLQYHPDVCPPSAKEESTKRFVELQKAYETLSDPITRRTYDYELGLANSGEFWFEGFQMGKRTSSNFPKEVWEEQLFGLEQRASARAAGRKKKNYV